MVNRPPGGGGGGGAGGGYCVGECGVVLSTDASPRDEPEVLPLRFGVGTKVKCRTGGGGSPTVWLPGEIVMHWWRDERWPQGKFAPYQVRLDDGLHIYAPLDEDRIIKKLLRFDVGSRVQCRTSANEDAWIVGTVVEHGPTEIAPYHVELDSGRKIWAPIDDDRVIRTVEQLRVDGLIPVTIFTGFLGSGKTTLMKHILKAPHGKRYAVIEHEMGSVGIDQQLPRGSKAKMETMTQLDNGCFCCTVKGDLIEAIQNIVRTERTKEKALDGILIETTGLADPGQICKSFYESPFVQTYCKIDGVIAVVDALHFVTQLTQERFEGSVCESAQQVAFADKVLLNKIDLVTPEQIAYTMDAIRGVNAFATVIRSSIGTQPDLIPLGELLSIDAFDIEKMVDVMGMDLSVCGVVEENEDTDDFDSGVSSILCELVGPPITKSKFSEFLHDLLEHSVDLYRYKGILAVLDPHDGKTSKYVVQGVHNEIDEVWGDDWPSDQPLKSQLVLIGRNLDQDSCQKSFATLGQWRL